MPDQRPVPVIINDSEFEAAQECLRALEMTLLAAITALDPRNDDADAVRLDQLRDEAAAVHDALRREIDDYLGLLQPPPAAKRRTLLASIDITVGRLADALRDDGWKPHPHDEHELLPPNEPVTAVARVAADACKGVRDFVQLLDDSRGVPGCIKHRKRGEV